MRVVRDLAIQGNWKADYVPVKDEPIIITGGNAIWWYLRGKSEKALQLIQQDLELIADAEKENGAKYHKGYFYMAAADCHRTLYHQYLCWAYTEDVRTYGTEKAKSFPAYKALKKAGPDPRKALKKAGYEL